MRHLLVISHFFPPMGGGGVQRVTKFVKYLERHGWRSTVIAGRPEDYWMRDESLLAELPGSARVLRTASASGLGVLRRLRPAAATSARRSSTGFSALRRAAAWFLVPDTYVGWQPFAMRAARQVLRDDPPEALLSTGPPETNHRVALRLRSETGVPWLADFRDPWFALHLHPAPTAWHRARHARQEREVLASADCVVATTSWLRDLLRERAPRPLRRLHVIRNGFDPEDFPALDSAPAASYAAAPLRLVHTGMLTLTRSAEGLLRGVQLLLERRPELRGQIEVELVGARESRNDAVVHELGLDACVRLRGYVPHREAVAAMLAADVLVLVKHLDPSFRGLVPGKLYEYLGARRPILALVPESEAADLVRQARCGEVASPDDAAAIAAHIERFLECKRAGALHSTYTCEPLAAFQRPEQARNLAALLEQIAPRRAGAVA